MFKFYIFEVPEQYKDNKSLYDSPLWKQTSKQINYILNKSRSYATVQNHIEGCLELNFCLNIGLLKHHFDHLPALLWICYTEKIAKLKSWAPGPLFILKSLLYTQSMHHTAHLEKL